MAPLAGASPRALSLAARLDRWPQLAPARTELERTKGSRWTPAMPIETASASSSA